MKKACFASFSLSGVNITEYGLKIPSPFCSLELSNSEIASYTSWTLKVVIGGDQGKRVNIAAFEALIYQAAQTDSYANASGVPVSFMFGWLDDNGNTDSYLSYQGYTLKYSVSTSGMFMTYTLTGYASQALKGSMPVLNIPALSGYVQPSAVLIALAKAIKADRYYELDVDRCDSPTVIQHGAMTTSFISYVRGTKTGSDNYTDFPGLVTLSKSYNASRDAAGLAGHTKLSTLMNNLSVSNVGSYLKKSITDNTPQCSTFNFWMDEPTMTKPGVIHYKSTASIEPLQDSQALKYGTSDSNILSLSGNYNGIAYNMADMNFSSVGFTLSDSGETISNASNITNSWSSSVENVYQSANIINDINALATQFSGDFEVTIAGSAKGYEVCEPVSLIVMSGNTLSPISGVYNIQSVTHSISSTFVTRLKIQRLAISSANQTATSMGILINGQGTGTSSINQTSNIKSPGLVDFGEVYPTWEHINIV